MVFVCAGGFSLADENHFDLRSLQYKCEGNIEYTLDGLKKFSKETKDIRNLGSNYTFTSIISENEQFSQLEMVNGFGKEVISCKIGKSEGTFYFFEPTGNQVIVTSDQAVAAERFLWITSHADALLWPFSSFGPQFYQFGTRPPARDLGSVKQAIAFFKQKHDEDSDSKSTTRDKGNNPVSLQRIVSTELGEVTTVWEFLDENLLYPQTTKLLVNGEVFAEHRVTAWEATPRGGLLFPKSIVINEYKEGTLTKRRNVEITSIDLEGARIPGPPFGEAGSVLDLDIDETFNIKK